MFGWLLGKRDEIQSIGDKLQTKPGQNAYHLAQKIADAEDFDKWKNLMDLYYKTTKPEAKVEVLKMADALAKTMGMPVWKREVKAKRQELRDHGYL